MKKIQFGLLLFFTFLFVGSQPTLACGCRLPSREMPLNEIITNEINRAGAVFSGKVIKIIDSRDNPLIEIKFKVDNLWKGESGGEISLFKKRQLTSCDFNFKVGEKYLVYARGDLSLLYTNVCGRTTALKNAEEDLKILGEGKKVSSNETKIIERLTLVNANQDII